MFPGGSRWVQQTQPRCRFVWDWLHLLHPSRPHRGRVGTKRPSPGAGLCGASRLCCTQAAPTGGGWVQKHTALGPGCVGLAASAAPEPPPPGAGGYNKSSPGAGLCGAGRLCCTQAAPTGGEWVQNPAPVPVCVGLASSAAPRPPHRGRVGTTNPAPGPGCGGLALAAAPEPPPPGAGGHKIQPRCRVVWGWPPLLHPSRPHRGRVGTKRPSPGAGLCGAGRLCCTQAAPTGGGWAQKHTAPRPVCAELAAGLLHRRRMMKKRRRKG